MKRRSVLTGFATLAGGGVVVSSGAFTSVEGDREAQVEIVNEAEDSYLQLRPSEEDNAAYVSQTGPSDIFALDFNDATPFGDSLGANVDSEFEFHDVFVVQNDGSQTVYFWLDEVTNQEGYELNEFNLYVGNNPSAIIDGDGVVELPEGNEVLIGVYIDTPADLTEGDETQNEAVIEANVEAPDNAVTYDSDGNEIQ